MSFDFTSLIWPCIGIATFILAGKFVIPPIIKEVTKAKAGTAGAKPKASPSGFIAQAQDLIKNAESKLVQIDKELGFLQEKGATEEQMAHLKMERGIVEMANNPIAKMFGEPIIDLAVQAAKKVGLNLR